MAVVSVRSFKARHEFMREQFLRHSLIVDWIFEADAVDLSDELQGYAVDTLSKPAISLVEKNRIAMQRFLATSAEYALIFEDDAILSRTFLDSLYQQLEYLETIEGAFALTLGGADDRVSRKFLRYPKPIVPRLISTTEAIVINRKAASQRLSSYFSSIIDLPLDHLYQKGDPSANIAHYWVKNPLVQQASQQGLLPSTIDAKRSRSGLVWAVFGQLRFWSKRFRKQWLPRLLNRL